MGSRPTYLYIRGQIVPYEEAQVHILTTAFKYSASIFEGIRAYWSDRQDDLLVFRLREHLMRLSMSSKIARIQIPITADEIQAAMLRLVRKNDLREDLHIRVLVYVAEDNGLMGSTEPVEVAIAAIPMGRFPEAKPGKDALDVGISHWQRLHDNAMSPRVKSTANYMNSRLALMQARDAGYDDAVLLDSQGKVTEGPGYNVFVVRDGRLVTPPRTQGILEGITRDTLCQLYREAEGRSVEERVIDKSELYIVEEAFFCGSGKEVTPIRSFDGIALDVEAPGPVTAAMRDRYFAVARGESDTHGGWVTAVYNTA